MNLDVRNKNGNTALMIAAREGQLNVVNRLISLNNEKVLDLLLEWKRSDNKLSRQYVEQWKKSDLSFKNNRNVRGEMALWLSLNHRHLDRAEVLMNTGCGDRKVFRRLFLSLLQKAPPCSLSNLKMNSSIFGATNALYLLPKNTP